MRIQMKKIVPATLIATLLAGSALAEDVRIMWYSDGNEGEVMQDILDRFMQDNPDINVVLDNVSFQVVNEQLPISLEAGEGPDIARVTNLKALSKHWLDLTDYVADAEYWKSNYGAQADWMRPDDSDAITGFMTQLTITGGFANRTLFEQAGVEMPGEGATWDDWVDASSKVAENQQLAAAFAIDRSGHRLSGPSISYGANYIGGDGMPAPVDDGVKSFISKLVEWSNDGKNLRDVWVSAAGGTYRDASEDFVNAQIPFYYSGSWQIANLSSKIGDTFDWVATKSPCGTAACSGMAGGAGLVAVKYTKSPEAVGKLMDYLASEDVVKEFSERTLFLPANAGLVAKGGLDFKSEDPQVKAALDAFVAASGDVAPNASALPAWKWASAYYTALVTRTSQAIAGEIGIDEAFDRMNSDIEEQVKQAAN